MRRYASGLVVLAFLWQGGCALAQRSSLDALEEDLKEAKQQHQEVTAEVLTNFFKQIDAAMTSPDKAISLYQKAGGSLPDHAPVVKAHDSETVTERDIREALDQANVDKMAAVLQLQCGLMHFAALFVLKPDQKGLHDDWLAWQQNAAQVYPQLGAVPPGQDPHQNNGDGGGPPRPTYNADDLKGKAMRDTIISKFLGFKGWGDKEQGGWSVRDLPGLYRANVLEPQRAAPTADTLAAWDTYIGMMNADEPDNNRWNDVVYPPLHFDRACDDYAVTPSTEKLEILVGLIKANPTYPQVDDWIARVHQLLADYRASHGGAGPVAPTPAPTPVPTDPNVTVTTTKQGDMTIIVTHTNSAPVTNAPPPH
jgi:hypothetical protein